MLALIYMLFPMLRAWRNRVTPLDWLCAAASLTIVAYINYQGPEFGDRAIDPDPLDFYVGVALIVLLLEAFSGLDHAGRFPGLHRLCPAR